MRILVAIIFLFFYSWTLNAQNSTSTFPPSNWFNEDPVLDSLNGVSTTRAYEFLKGRKSKTVLVAIIDSGIDINHEDLKDKIWTNKDEIPGNGVDDDHNGYVDDVHGWNFIGGKDGTNVGPDTYEVTREYKRLKPKFEGVKKSRKHEFEYWQEIDKSFHDTYAKSNNQYHFYDSLKTAISRYNQLLTAYLNVDKLTPDEVAKVNSPDQEIKFASTFMANILQMVGEADIKNILNQLDDAVDHFKKQVDYGYNLDLDTRKIVGDHPNQLNEVGYGNNDVIGKGTDHFHGTHVAGIIAADRENNIGIKGIANNVLIMPVRTVPDGDERDKDVANAIRYAVDNGAQIINMSFGKAYSPHKEYVDKAVEYAKSKNVLLVHAAGNAGEDTDDANNFPNRQLLNKKTVDNWIEVGASSWGEGKRLAASFSNYGKNSVDVFAPGVKIYSTAPDNEYRDAQGTSMASPVTAGVAALLLSYFPNLTPKDIREIIIESSRKFEGLMVIKPGTKDEQTDFSNLSVSGGIVNAYTAVRLADARLLKKK